MGQEQHCESFLKLTELRPSGGGGGGGGEGEISCEEITGKW